MTLYSTHKDIVGPVEKMRWTQTSNVAVINEMLSNRMTKLVSARDYNSSSKSPFNKFKSKTTKGLVNQISMR